MKIIYLYSLLLILIISSLKVTAIAQEANRVTNRVNDLPNDLPNDLLKKLGQLLLTPEIIDERQSEFEQKYLNSLLPYTGIDENLLLLAGDGAETAEVDRIQAAQSAATTPKPAMTEEAFNQYSQSLDKTYLYYQFQVDPEAPTEEDLLKNEKFLRRKMGASRFQEFKQKRQLLKNQSQNQSQSQSQNQLLQQNRQEQMKELKIFPPVNIPRNSPLQKSFVANFRDSTGAMTVIDLEKQTAKTEVVAPTKNCQELLDRYCLDKLEDIKCLKENKAFFPPECQEFLKSTALGIICNNQVRKFCGNTLHDNNLAAHCLEEKYGSFTEACKSRAKAISSQIRALQAQGKR